METVPETWHLLRVKILQLLLEELSINPVCMRSSEYLKTVSLGNKNEILSHFLFKSTYVRLRNLINSFFQAKSLKGHPFKVDPLEIN